MDLVKLNKNLNIVIEALNEKLGSSSNILKGRILENKQGFELSVEIHWEHTVTGEFEVDKAFVEKIENGSLEESVDALQTFFKELFEKKGIHGIGDAFSSEMPPQIGNLHSEENQIFETDFFDFASSVSFAIQTIFSIANLK